MKMSRIAAVLVSAGLVFGLFLLPVSAQDDGSGSPQQPAVEVTSPPAADTIPDWTYRYMIPTSIALALLVVVITSIQYFTRVVRKRYRIVE